MPLPVLTQETQKREKICSVFSNSTTFGTVFPDMYFFSFSEDTIMTGNSFHTKIGTTLWAISQ